MELDGNKYLFSNNTIEVNWVQLLEGTQRKLR